MTTLAISKKHSVKAIVLQTSNTWTPLILRSFLGLVVLPHGAQKLFGWFGGYGFSGTMGYFTDTVGLPWIVSLLIIVLESVGALALITGLGTRLIAFSYSILALGIVFTSHLEHGFFMNWSGNQSGEGIEYFLFWIAIAVSLTISGGGRYSIDRYLFRSNAA